MERKVAVYIASPYTKGDIDQNVRRSLMVANELIEKGFVPFTPLLTHFWHIISPKSWDVWMEMDREWVLRCDCVLRLVGESVGADEEVKLAHKNHILVFYTIPDLCEFYSRR